jgi:hypothetical protein
MPAAKGSAHTPLGPIVVTFVYASSQGQRMHSTRTKIGVNSGHLVQLPWGCELAGPSTRLTISPNPS